MTRVAILVVLVVLAGCKGTHGREASNAIAKMKQFATSMCACKDKACADKIQEEVTRWGEEMAKSGGGRDEKPDEAMMKEMVDAGQRYAECMSKLMLPEDPTEPPAPPDAPPPPAKPEIPATAPASPTVAQLLTLAREFAAVEAPPLVVAAVEASYVDADGKLDADAGELTIVLGSPIQPADDPKRRTGAPARPRSVAPTDCKVLHWTRERGWWFESSYCVEVRPPYPLCTVTEIWKRAIAKGAPADAVAVVQINQSLEKRWLFTITDEPRNVKIQHLFPDNCALAVEKPF